MNCTKNIKNTIKNKTEKMEKNKSKKVLTGNISRAKIKNSCDKNLQNSR